MQTHRLNVGQTHRHTDTQTHRHTDKKTHKYRHVFKHTDTDADAATRTHILSELVFVC